MKYAILRFQSEQEFQSFFGQLASAEVSNFQAVEGSAGDGGFDGISETTAYQAYYPEENRRTEANYIKKIDDDVDKVIVSSKKLGLTITDWIFVVPEDLRIAVIAHLQKVSKQTSINCTHWGATKLTELITKHPHIQESFPTIFLPPVHDGIKDIQRSIEGIHTQRNDQSYVQIVTDDEFWSSRERLRKDHKAKVKPYHLSNGRPDRSYIPLIIECEKEAESEYYELKQKKDRSDQAFELDLKELEAKYERKIEEAKESLAIRGLLQSGIGSRIIGLLEIEKNRKVERLKLKYGKRGVMIPERLLDPDITVFVGGKRI